ncbi:MAG: glutathione peroxidase [Verrucomicrobiota bacterium]|jgi:glutathione peroxidase|nr:glutathione peroxidase [Verrucomicrobiota bacterium]
MKSILKKSFAWILTMSVLGTTMTATMQADHHNEKNALSFEMKTLEDKAVNLKDWKGKVLLMVNVASKCGYTPQYDGLQKLHSEFKDKGFSVVGFPCNNFGSQEPGSHAEIMSFCKENYGVTFPMMGKIDVKGSKQAPLYKYLTSHPDHGGGVRWNFEKFLVDKQGNVIGHYRSGVKPTSNELKMAINKALQAK